MENNFYSGIGLKKQAALVSTERQFTKNN